jgi:hypothetical protein
MIGHDHIPANSPPMASVSCPPLLHENSTCFVLRKNSLSVLDARGDVVDRKIDPNALQSPQVLVHIALVAEGGDLGEPKKLRRTCHRGQRPRLQLLRGKNRFRVPTGNSSHRNPTEAANERAQ